MNQILALPNNYQEIDQNKINKNKIKKTKKILILPLILSTILGISSYKIYAYVSNLQDNKNSYVHNAETNNIKQSNDIIKNEISSNNTENETVQNNNDIKSETNTQNKSTVNNKYKASNGKTYETIAILNIPSLNIEYPVLSSTSEELLKISLNKFWGPEPNEVGNMCIVGHNYEDSRFFGKLNQIKKGAIVKITDLSGRTIEYKVYDTYVVTPYDTACTSQLTNGKTEITLITCYSNGTKRFVVKAIAK